MPGAGSKDNRTKQTTTSSDAILTRADVRWSGVLGRLGDALYSVNPDMPFVPNETSKIKSSWYLSPERHIIEAVIVWAYILWFSHRWYNGMTGFSQWHPEPGVLPQPLNTYDYALGIVCILDGLVLLCTKFYRGRLWFMLQPCNIWAPLLAYVCLSRSEASIWIFNFYLHVMWGSFLGALAADLRDYESILEIIFFFVHHGVIIIVPILYIRWNTFPIYPLELEGCWAIQIFQHFCIYANVSILSGWHIQYMCHPPKQLRSAQQNYRIVMMAGSWGMTWLTQTSTVILGNKLRRSIGMVDLASGAVLTAALVYVFARKPPKRKIY